MTPSGILETVIYVSDLDSAKRFYRDVLGMSCFAKADGRQVFFRCGDQVFLIFNPEATSQPDASSQLPVPPHGAYGAGHVCFRATSAEIGAWRERLVLNGVEIEADFEWPQGGRSIYFRDPAGNCLEFAEPRIWGLN